MHHEYPHSENHHSSGKYIREVVFAASDGLVTTFAVVSGSVGAHLSAFVIIILGVANLIADGFSMGLGEYIGSKSEAEYNRAQRAKEEMEIDTKPQAEVAEVRTIFKNWGFTGDILERATEQITKNRDAWVDIMMKFELGVDEAQKSPLMSGLVMFVSFVVIGAVPLVSFLFHFGQPFTWAIILSALVMFTVGALRSRVLHRVWWRAGSEMLLVGILAAGSAYAIGRVLSAAFHVQ